LCTFNSSSRTSRNHHGVLPNFPPESDNGVKVKNACPVACGTCDEWIVKAFACSQCREKDGVSSCENQWKCVFPGDQCEGACIGCNKRNNDFCYQLEQLL